MPSGGSTVLHFLSRRRARGAARSCRCDFRDRRPRASRARARRPRGAVARRCSRSCARSRRGCRPAPARDAHLAALARGRHGGRRDRAAGRAVPRAALLLLQGGVGGGAWRARWRPRRACRWCRCSGCRPRTTTSRRSPRCTRRRRRAARRDAGARADEAAAEARVSVAHRRLGAEVDRARSTRWPTRSAGRPGGRRDRWRSLRAHYRAGRRLAEAFAGLLAALFADEGLLVLDPRVPRVAALARAGLRDARSRTRTPSTASWRARAAALAAAGFDEQIPVRPDCSLLFFHARRPGRPALPPVARRRGLERWSGASTSLGRRGSRGAGARPAALLDVGAAAPHRAGHAAADGGVRRAARPRSATSPSSAPLYEHFGLPPPLVVPRARFRLPRRARPAGCCTSSGSRPATRPCSRAELLTRLGAGATLRRAPDPDGARAPVAGAARRPARRAR